MQNRDASAPEVVVEGGSERSERTWRIATLAVVGLTVFVCLCFAGVLLLNTNLLGLGSQGPASAASPTRRSAFAATWTPTPTETATPTAPPRPTATPTRTPTLTPIPTNTPVPPTATNTPRPPTNTPRPRPTNTPRPTATPTHTPVPPTNTPTYLFRIEPAPVSYQNCGSLGVFGTVRDRNGNLIGEMRVLVAAPSGNAFVATSTGNYINNSTDRNFEISNANGLGAGTYTVFLATKVGNDYIPASGSASVNISPLGDACGSEGNRTQWWKVEFRQN